MKSNYFREVVDRRIDLIKKTLAIKAMDYSRDDNRIHNFERAAEMLRCTPEQACIAFMTKHMVSILDMVNDMNSGAIPDAAAWDEKIGDAINYLILLECIIHDRTHNGAII